MPTEKEDPRSRGPRFYVIDGCSFSAPVLEAGLYIVATPIGNLSDVTLRALATLAGAYVIACEDTRLTSRLTRHYTIRAKLLAYHEHNAERQTPRLLAELAEGRAVALVSDAGTPLISDPGQRLVGAVIEAGHRVIPIPGPSAVIAALSSAGLPTDAFHFVGFLPPRQAARRKRLALLAAIPATLVFYESPHRTAAALTDMAAELGPDRSAVMARELTKTFETLRRGTLTSLAAELAAEADPKGEIVLLVGPPISAAPKNEEVEEKLAELLKSMSVGAAASELAVSTGLPRRELYRRALELRSLVGRHDEE